MFTVRHVARHQYSIVCIHVLTCVSYSFEGDLVLCSCEAHSLSTVLNANVKNGLAMTFVDSFRQYIFELV